MITRRSFLRGLLAAPIVVRSGLVMPVKPLAHLEGEMLTIASTPHPWSGELRLDLLRKAAAILQANCVSGSYLVHTSDGWVNADVFARGQA